MKFDCNDTSLCIKTDWRTIVNRNSPVIVVPSSSGSSGSGGSQGGVVAYPSRLNELISVPSFIPGFIFTKKNKSEKLIYNPEKKAGDTNNIFNNSTPPTESFIINYGFIPKKSQSTIFLANVDYIQNKKEFKKNTNGGIILFSIIAILAIKHIIILLCKKKNY